MAIKKKWIVDTKIARKMNDGKITDYRLNQKTENFELCIEYDDGKGEYLTIGDGSWATPYTATSSGLYTLSGSSIWYDDGVFYVDSDTCATVEPGTGYIEFAKKEVE